MNNFASPYLLSMDARPPAERFALLAKVWREETAILSSIQDIVNHPAYQQIIGMGPQALRMIMRALHDESAYWFWALTAIAGEDVADGNPSFASARDAWLEWGVARDLIEADKVVEREKAGQS